MTWEFLAENKDQRIFKSADQGLDVVVTQANFAAVFGIAV
jgi:hypothetical protein